MLIRQYGQQIRIDTPAKVNFFLELHGRRDDGFHQIDTVMQTVSLWDQLRFDRTDVDGVELSCQLRQPSGQPAEQDSIPTDHRNLVVRACQRLREYASENQLAAPVPSWGLKIELTKWIPSAAGLGGASSDCAAALVGANRAWGLGLSLSELHSIAAELGSDVPFFLYGGACRCTGRGEIIEPVSAVAGVNLVIVKPPVALSTKEVFSRVGSSDDSSRDDSIQKTLLTDQQSSTAVLASAEATIKAISTGRPQQIAGSLFNRLAEPAAQMTDQLDRMSYLFEQAGSLGHQMSGSGSSYFGIFTSRKSARIARQQLASQLSDCRVFAVRTLAASDEVIAPEMLNSLNSPLAHEGTPRWK